MRKIPLIYYFYISMTLAIFVIGFRSEKVRQDFLSSEKESQTYNKIRTFDLNKLLGQIYTPKTERQRRADKLRTQGYSEGEIRKIQMIHARARLRSLRSELHRRGYTDKDIDTLIRLEMSKRKPAQIKEDLE